MAIISSLLLGGPDWVLLVARRCPAAGGAAAPPYRNGMGGTKNPALLQERGELKTNQTICGGGTTTVTVRPNHNVNRIKTKRPSPRPSPRLGGERVVRSAGPAKPASAIVEGSGTGTTGYVNHLLYRRRKADRNLRSLTLSLSFWLSRLRSASPRQGVEGRKWRSRDEDVCP